ncbi:MAG: hypothetical protein VCE91_10520 [Nitrospinota bacterium]
MARALPGKLGPFIRIFRMPHGVGDIGSLGGDVVTPLRVDMIYDNPTAWAGDEIILKEGRIVV